MSEPTLDRFKTMPFRAGGAYELVLFDRLPPEEQAPLGELRADPDFYGVLKPRPGSGRTVKAVGKDTALLWLTLQAPGPLPSFVWAGDEGAAVRAVTGLLLDGVLEMEHQGAFVSGPAAGAVLAVGGAEAPQGRLAHLSIESLRCGEALGLDDPRQLASRLYAFHRLPLTPAWARRLPGGEAVLAFLGAGPGTELRRRLDRDWTAAEEGSSPGWLAWAHHRFDQGAVSRGTHKLYVSPAMEALPRAFAAVVEILSRRGGAFKVGADASGVLRPDKLVLYFRSLDRLLEVASELARALAGAPAHGVPFSAEIAGEGLLSWGMDPPAGEGRLAWQEPESWRLWVVRRLAAALVAAQRDAAQSGAAQGDGAPAEPPLALPPWRFALERLRRDGVDVDRWIPEASIWQAA